MITFTAPLLRPDPAPRNDAWSFLTLPAKASAKLPTRSMTSVTGTLNGQPFTTTLQPDGRKGHWMKVPRKLREAAGVEVGAEVTLAIAPAEKEPEARVPADLKKALAADPKARAVWADITPIARRDWIAWITSAKLAETRTRRVRNACQMLAGGKRRVCCFDRSGAYSQGFSAPRAAR